MNKFVNLKMKLTAVTQAVAEIDRFTGEEMPDDNQLAAEHKQAQKRAEKLQTNLQTACNELTALTVIADECFGDEFFSSISAFVEETRKNEKARDKVLDMRSRLLRREIVTRQTNITLDLGCQRHMDKYPEKLRYSQTNLGQHDSRKNTRASTIQHSSDSKTRGKI